MKKPRKRGECNGIPRPCPFITCRYHLARNGHIIREDLMDADLNCALDVAEFGGVTEYDISILMGINESTVAHISRSAFNKIAANDNALTYKE